MDVGLFVVMFGIIALITVAGTLIARYVSKRQTIAAGVDYRDPDRLTLIVYAVLGVLMCGVVAFFIALMLGTRNT